MSCRKMVIKVKHIILGTLYNIFNVNWKLANSRLRICKICSKHKKIKGLGYICTECGCILKSKATIEDEVCKLNKW